MMIVVVPLRAVFSARRVLVCVKQSGGVVVVLKHQVDMPVSLSGKVADRAAEFAQHRDFAGLGDGMHRVQPQPVETVFAQPIQRILDGEGAYLWYPIVDRAAPRGLRLRKEAWRIAAEVISFGAEVIV